MLKSREVDDVKPVCPYCEEEIDEVFCQELKCWFGVRYVHFCPGCHKVLGVSHRKGFFMG